MSKNIPILILITMLIFGSALNLFAQDYPDRPITLVIPMAPGDAVDISGRLIVDELTKLLKVPVTPLNKPGAGGVVGTDLVVKSKKDGYTILLANNSALISAKILNPENVPYDALKDLTPLGMCTVAPTLITVKNESPYKNLKDLVEYAKKNPGKIRCGTPGVGTLADFNVPIIEKLTGAKMTIVPFKGASPSVSALLGGHVETVASAITPVINHLRSGELRGVVISKKLPEFPDIPTLKQLGYQQDLFGIWIAYFAPPGIPNQIKETLVSAIEKVAKDPMISSKMAKMGLVYEFEPPEKVLASMVEEYKMSEEIAKKFGLVK
jgi:tripartite-type tricarboxylate transporter receptor subunit TctC